MGVQQQISERLDARKITTQVFAIDRSVSLSRLEDKEITVEYWRNEISILSIYFLSSWLVAISCLSISLWYSSWLLFAQEIFINQIAKYHIEYLTGWEIMNVQAVSRLQYHGSSKFCFGAEMLRLRLSGSRVLPWRCCSRPASGAHSRFKMKIIWQKNGVANDASFLLTFFWNMQEV